MKLLLIGDERKNRRLYAWGFAAEPYRVRLAATRAGVEELLERESFQAVCLDLKMQGESAGPILDLLHRRLPELPIIALIGAAERKSMPALKDKGVCAHLVSPFPIESLHAAVRAHALRQPVGGADKADAPAKAETVQKVDKGGTASAVSMPSVVSPTKLFAADELARRTHELALRAARSSAAILIVGETGTGKSQLAQAIHQHSALRQKAFVAVNCPCLSQEMLERELFGHARGAFPGAVHESAGKIAAAEGGTLFLDEVGDLPAALQPKLLRLLQERQYERVGETGPRLAHVRIIATTSRDLKKDVAAGRFREDLYYRLNVVAIEAPALRNRPAQIMAAAEAMLHEVCAQLEKRLPGFTAEARRVLESYAWPGNLRELRNEIERAAILSNGAVLDAADFPALTTAPAVSRYQVGSPISLHALETAHIQMVVASSASLEEAARILEIDKSTLYRKRKAMEARVESFSSGRESLALTGNTAVAAG
jgi:NtrC-family two-component system response regulator AlgB